MRRWLAVVALAASACGGADDGEVFGADAGATSYGPSGLPNCETTCDAKGRAYCSVPGKTKAELDGKYTVTETHDVHGKTEVIKVSAEDEAGRLRYSDGLVTLVCFSAGNGATFTSR